MHARHIALIAPRSERLALVRIGGICRFLSIHHGATETVCWCPGRGSNPHGLAAKGFSYQLRLSPLRPHHDRSAFVVWTFSLPYRWIRIRSGSGVDLGRSRQVSTLSRYASGLSSGLPPPLRAEVSPSLTPFTSGVSDLSAQFTQVPCVYQFRHPGRAGESYAHVIGGHNSRGRPCATRCGSFFHASETST